MKHSGTYFYGYTIIAVSFFIQAVVWGTGNSFGIFFDPLLSEFGWLRGTLSGAASLCFLVHGITSILVGNLNDRFGPRLIMTACGLFLGLGFFLMSRVHTVWQLYLFYGLVVGIGLSGTDVVPLSTLARWFERKRGMMSGIIKVGTGVGMLAMPIFITWVLNSRGWRDTFAILGLIIFSAVVVLAQFLVRDPTGKSQCIDNRKEIDRCRSNSAEAGLSFQAAIRTRQFKTICAVYFIILVCAFTVVIHIVQHAIDLGIAAGPAAGILAAVGGVSIAGRFVMGTAGDRIGDKTALSICLLILLMALGWLQLADRLWMFYAFAGPLRVCPRRLLCPEFAVDGPALRHPGPRHAAGHHHLLQHRGRGHRPAGGRVPVRCHPQLQAHFSDHGGPGRHRPGPDPVAAAALPRGRQEIGNGNQDKGYRRSDTEKSDRSWLIVEGKCSRLKNSLNIPPENIKPFSPVLLP